MPKIKKMVEEKKKRISNFISYTWYAKMHGAMRKETMSANSSIYLPKYPPYFLAIIPSIPSARMASKTKTKDAYLFPCKIKKIENKPNIPFKIVKESA